MLRDGNEEMSTIPGFSQIQFEGFCRFISQGLMEEFQKFPKIEDTDHEIEFKLFVETYQLQWLLYFFMSKKIRLSRCDRTKSHQFISTLDHNTGFHLVYYGTICNMECNMGFPMKKKAKELLTYT